MNKRKFAFLIHPREIADMGRPHNMSEAVCKARPKAQGFGFGIAPITSFSRRII